MTGGKRDSGIPWIGEIPEGWKLKPLRYAASIRSESVIFPNDGEKIYIGLENIESHSGRYVATESEYDNSQCNIFECGDVLFGKLRPYLAKVLHTDFSGYCCNELIVFKRFDGNQRFLFYYLLSEGFLDAVNASTYGAKMPRANWDHIKKLPVPIPPLSEQKAIADFLDERCGLVDSVAADIEDQIETLRKYKKSLITEAVTKGLDKSAPMKDSGVPWIGEMPEHWEVCRFRGKITFGNGLNITKADLVEDGVAVVSYGQIHSKENSGVTLPNTLLKYVPVAYLSQNPSCVVKKGDLVFADTSEDYNGVGNFIYNDRDDVVLAGYHSIIARPIGDDYCQKYLAYLFLTDAWRSQIRSKVMSVKVFSITRKLFRETSILLPPKTEQKAIADYLDGKCSAIDAVIAGKQKQLAALKRHRSSLVFEYVTGRKRVKED